MFISFVLHLYVNINDLSDWGHEYYSGENYIGNSSEKSYSRNWRKGKGMPKKYNFLTDVLLEIYLLHNSKK